MERRNVLRTARSDQPENKHGQDYNVRPKLPGRFKAKNKGRYDDYGALVLIIVRDKSKWD